MGFGVSFFPFFNTLRLIVKIRDPILERDEWLSYAAEISLNVIHYPLGWKKKTLNEFLYAMFYMTSTLSPNGFQDL